MGDCMRQPDTYDGVPGCPCNPSGRDRDSGGCCLGEYNDWCSDNYERGFICENNACGNDDCCVRNSTAVVIVALVGVAAVIAIIITCIVCCVCRQSRARQRRAMEQFRAQQNASAAGGGAAMGGVAMPVAAGVPNYGGMPVAAGVPIPAVAPPTMCMVAAPPGSREGDTVQVVSPQGQTMQVKVPAGVGPDGQFQVQFPAIVVAPAVPVAYNSGMPLA